MSGLNALLAAVDMARVDGASLVLATILGTEGSTYRKTGAQMLLAEDGSAIGLLSGGCLETDLAEQAREVRNSGAAKRLRYDMRPGEDSLFGLGLGCNGALEILLSPLGPDSDYRPLSWLAQSHPPAYALVLADAPGLPTGTVLTPGLAAWQTLTQEQALGLAELLTTASSPQRRSLAGLDCLLMPPRRPLHLLILGAGPDVPPLLVFARELGWRVTVADHRPAFLCTERLPGACLLPVKYRRAATSLPWPEIDAVVVMSHHLEADQHYLAALAESAVPFIGLLGPSARRDFLLAALGEPGERLRPRLHAPVGLDLGGDSPAAIALAIVAEIEAHFRQRDARPLHEKNRPLHD